MILDTHVHLLINKHSRPNWDEIRFTFDVAIADGLDVLCITEHRDSQGYEELIEELFLKRRFDGQFLGDGVFRLANGLIISAAAEVALADGGDIGVHASPSALLEIDNLKGAYTGASLFNFLKKMSCEYVTVAHHLLAAGKWPADIDRWSPSLDAVELPGKQLDLETQYRRLGNQIERPMVGGSDAHTWIQVGTCRSDVEMDAESGFNLPRFKAAVRNKKVKALPSANAARFVGFSKLYRQRLERAESSSVLKS